MKILKSVPFFIFLLAITRTSYSQVIQQSGYIYSELSATIAAMPSDSGNHYKEPNTAQLQTWENTLTSLLAGNYSTASDSANSIGYNLIQFTDTFVSPSVTYYVLKTIDSNYWGTYVYNPNYCRPLVIQAPHAKKDANTGLQGIHVFRKTESLFYQVNGTHRCNSSTHTSCSGTTTGCSSTSEPYRISDLAHTTESMFQKTTEVLLNAFNNTHFIQLHGFTKATTDPYLVLSNGTQITPSPDYMTAFKNNLYLEDTVLTFKIAHIDLSWTRLRGFWNTQSRLVNASPNPCNTSGTTTNGRFFHIEQERTRLRASVSGWNKVANALKNTFVCSYASINENAIESKVLIYPNPSSHLITVEGKELDLMNKEAFIYNLLGQNMSEKTSLQIKHPGKAVVDLSNLPRDLYLIRIGNAVYRIYKN